MEQQRLSEQANSAFYEKLENVEQHRKKNVPLKVIAVAACVCLLISTVVIAADSIFGRSVVEETDRPFVGSDGKGYDISFTNVYSRPISDFSPEIQSFDGSKSVGYDTWEAAETEIGIDLITNPFFSDKKTYMEKAFDIEVDSSAHVSGSNLHHCVADYAGKDGQLYYVLVSAMYKRDGMFIDVRATVTADHPAISQEEVERMHWHGFTYPKADVEQISQKQYTAQNGLTATIVEVDRTENQFSFYEATFAANGVSYWVRVNADSGDLDKEARELLINLLEAFSF